MTSGEVLPSRPGSVTWEWDLLDGTDSYSAAAIALVCAGRPRDEGIDRKLWFRSIHPDDAERVQATVAHALARTERWHVGYRLCCADGQVRRFDEKTFVVRQGNRVIRVLGVLLHTGEDSPTIEHSEELYRAIVDFIPQLCWAADANGWIDVYNRRWYEYTGTTPEQMEGWGWIDVHDPLDLPRMLRIWRNALVTGEPWEDEFRMRRGADGMLRWHLSRAMPLRDANGRIIRWFGTNTDIHDQKVAAPVAPIWRAPSASSCATRRSD